MTENRERMPQTARDASSERAVRAANLAWHLERGRSRARTHLERLHELEAAGLLMDEHGFQRAATGWRP